MKHKKLFKIIFLIIGILFPFIIVTIMACYDLSSIWNSWGIQDDGSHAYPDFWNYILLVVFKLSLYVIPSFIIAIGLALFNKHNIQEKTYFYYVLNVMSIWFLILLSLKLIADSILELDRIFDIKIFESIKDVQTLAGFIITIILKRTYEVKPGFAEKDKLIKTLDKNK